jgi:pre-mRNA-processing factor 39
MQEVADEQRPEKIDEEEPEGVDKPERIEEEPEVVEKPEMVEEETVDKPEIQEKSEGVNNHLVEDNAEVDKESAEHSFRESDMIVLDEVRNEEESNGKSKEQQRSDEDEEMEVEEAKKRPAADLHTEEEDGKEEPPLKKNKTETGDCEERKEEEEEEAEKKYTRSPELIKFWKVVEDDPSDFTGWTYLLQYIDSHGSLDEGREAFDAFLFRYCYCYGYWKKYADFEKRKGTRESCMAVFERGVKAIPLSADLWIHFMNYVKAEFVENDDFIREFYTKSVQACGKQWSSDKLWDSFVKWELALQETAETKDYRRVMKLYDQILLNPTQGLTHQFDMFREFVKDHNPKDMLEVEDFLSLRKEILLAMAGDEKEKVEETEDGIPPPGEGETGAKIDEENLAMKEKIIHARRKVFKETEAKVQLRWKFEENIKRPYFHIKPLERGQLKNWNEYLEFEQKQDEPVLVEILFERCLIACALYEEFWIKYTEWMIERISVETDLTEKEKLVEKTRQIFNRACTHHLATKVDVHLAWSAFEETRQNFDRAIEILEKIEKEHPKMMSLMSRHINAERRRGNADSVHSLYKKCIENAKTPMLRSEWSIKYSRFLRMKCDDEAGAIRVLEDAVLVDEKNPKLYLQLLDVYLHQKPLNESKIIEVFDAALTKEKGKMLSDKHRLLFSQRKSEFLEEFGSSISELLIAQAAHSKLSVELKPNVKDSEAGSNQIKTVDSSHRPERQSNGSSTTTYQATNSSSYAAQHNSQYQQYGSRYGYQGYSQYPPNYYQGYNY